MRFFKQRNKKENDGLQEGRLGMVSVKVTTEYTSIMKPPYVEIFIKDAGFTVRRAKQTYIRNEYHDRIKKILTIVGDGKVSMASYIDNVLEEHFKTYEEDISVAFDKSIDTCNI